MGKSHQNLFWLDKIWKKKFIFILHKEIKSYFVEPIKTSLTLLADKINV